MIDIFMIKDAAIPVMLYQAQPPTSSGMSYIEGPYVLTKLVDRSSV